MAISGRVNKIIKFSSVDGPGNRAAIFLQGCNFNCIYCHNPETIRACIHCLDCVAACPQKALKSVSGKVVWDKSICVNCDCCIKACKHLSSPRTSLMTSEDVFREIGNAIPFIRGITVSGGECSLQAGFIMELFTLAKQKNLSTFIDSNGYVDFSSMNELMAVTDSFMLDIKAFDEKEHRRITGKPNETVLKNAVFLGGLNKLFEIRTVIAPGLFDVYATVDAASKMIADFGATRYKLIKFRRIGVRENVKNEITEPDDELMEELREIARNNGVKDVVII